MPLLRKHLRPVYLFSQQEEDSGYVGTTTIYVPSHIEYCNIQPVTNTVTAEIYGERVYNMVSLMCELKANIHEGDRLSLSDFTVPSHKVVSVMTYTTHKTILAEVMGVGR